MQDIIDELEKELESSKRQLDEFPETDLTALKQMFDELNGLREQQSSLIAARDALMNVKQIEFEISHTIQKLENKINEFDAVVSDKHNKIRDIQSQGIKKETLEENVSNIASAIFRLNEFYSPTEVIPMKSDIDPWA